MLNNPRPHHYTFAHTALRMLCESNPLQFFEVMGSDERDKLLKFVLSKVVEQCEGDKTPDFDFDEVKIHTVKLGDYPTVLVVMPQVEAVTEAVMTAIVLTNRLDLEDPDNKISCRYFVLELSLSSDGNPQTSLCEWSGDEHLNHGDGPEPSVKAFLTAIESFIKA